MAEADLKRLNPPSIGKPVGAYSHGVLASTPGAWLHVSVVAHFNTGEEYLGREILEFFESVAA